MAIETKLLERSFRYNSVDLPDPGAQFNAEQVRDLYSGTYPEITTAAIEGPEEKAGKLVYTFRRAVGTKGNSPNNLSRALRGYYNRMMNAREKHEEDAELRRLLFDGAEFAAVLARIVEGQDVRRAFGAPGDWGYETAIGDGLFEFLSNPDLPRRTAAANVSNLITVQQEAGDAKS